MIDPSGLFAEMAEDEDDPFFLEPPDFAGTLARLRGGESLKPGQLRHLAYARAADLPDWMAFWRWKSTCSSNAACSPQPAAANLMRGNLTRKQPPRLTGCLPSSRRRWRNGARPAIYSRLNPVFK